jgi:hypothetical protein
VYLEFIEKALSKNRQLFATDAAGYAGNLHFSA